MEKKSGKYFQEESHQVEDVIKRRYFIEIDLIL